MKPPSEFYICKDSDMYKLEVKKSGLPVGQGLFATKPIGKGQIIGEYRGIVIEGKYCNHEYYSTEDKMVDVNTTYCILGRTCVAKANDIVKYEPHKYDLPQYLTYRKNRQLPDMEGLQRNAQIQTMEKDRVCLVATKDIQAGAEIFTAYGFDYWDYFLSRNSKLGSSQNSYK